jgi:DNA-binding MarR family transcriptional regulator
VSPRPGRASKPTAASAPADVRVALDALRRIVQALRLDARDDASGVRLSSAQVFALRQLREHPGASINELAALTFTHQSSVSVVVQRLVARGFVARLPASHDRRRHSFSLTAAGRRLLRRVPPAVQDRLIASIAALPPARRRVVVRALEALARSVAPKAAARHPPMFFEDAGRARTRSSSGPGGSPPSR